MTNIQGRDLSRQDAAYENIQENVGRDLSRQDASYEDVAGFCKSAKLDEIAKHDFVLTPGRYVGAAAEEDDGEPFADKMARLTNTLKEQFAESARLEAEIQKNLAGLGYDV